MHYDKLLSVSDICMGIVTIISSPSHMDQGMYCSRNLFLISCDLQILIILLIKTKWVRCRIYLSFIIYSVSQENPDSYSAMRVRILLGHAVW